ncbi:EAL domain-containing protein [Mesobacillus boroniphilus]|uniref:EAL domain-containing protein n=1 Tax=Mesobacillus boroniphilus TaxID=308892 RepID=A0A944CNP4_9BACI|nr:EAL domain-containing protein [Mesobacillus boroniphilus]MBS8266295.1 EAL domain-containing protein [Mesobacillus boroniphilus]
MTCNACVVSKLQYEIRVEGDRNFLIYPEVVRHMERNGELVRAEGDTLVVREAGMKDFLDFCHDHMEADSVYFRLDGEKWRGLTQAEEILDSQWIDEVIRKELVTCHAQPILDAEGGIYAYEMLARFYREDGSMIYPGEIFGAARKRDRLYALDRICRMAAVRAATFTDKKVFINFIPTSIYSPEFCLKSTTMLADRLGVNPDRLVFEVVETENVEDTDHLKRILAFYKEKGFRYALDDVGEGYSTLELLSDLQPHYMKLDMKYVQGVAQDPQKQRTATAFLAEAKRLGSVPLAEGIEAEEDFSWLMQKGYQLFQGYFFGKPAPIGNLGGQC